MAMAGKRQKEEEGIARRLWYKFRNESIFVLYSPFVICLASVVLDPRSFSHSLSQELFFLKAFVQAYELAEEYADDDEDKVSIRKLSKLTLKKINEFSDIVQEWGFELANESISDSAAVKYTDFLLATTSGKVGGEKFPGIIETPFEKTKLAAYTFAAVAPVVRFSACINKEILALQIHDQSDHIYKKWIEGLPSQNHEESATEIENLLEKLCVSLTGEELQVVEKIYYQAMKFQLQSFFALPSFQQVLVPFAQRCNSKGQSFSIFCDFDMTCSAIDSSAILAEIAIRKARKVDMDTSETQLVRMSSADLRNAWGLISRQYTDEYEECIDSIVAGERAEKFDYEGLCKALEHVSEFEKRANSRVIQSGVLKGLTREDMKRAGELLNLQDGCKGFFQERVKRENLNTDVHVLSYGWCGDMIRSAFSSGDMNIDDVYCNELSYEENISTGDMVRKVESPMEKLEALNERVNRQNNHVTICIGGTVGDILCLLNADIGIVINPSHSLMRLTAKFGISFVPLNAGLVKKQRKLTESGSIKWEGLSGIIYTVNSWAEIHGFVFGI